MIYYSEVRAEALPKLEAWFDKNIGTEYEIEQDDDGEHATFTSFDLSPKEADRLDEFLNSNNMYYDSLEDVDLEYDDHVSVEKIKKSPVVYS